MSKNSWEKDVVKDTVKDEVKEPEVIQAAENVDVEPVVAANILREEPVTKPVVTSAAKQQFSTRSEAREYANTVGGTVTLVITPAGTPVWEV